MIANKDGQYYEQYYERLHQRRGEILRTLDYLSKEKRTLDENRHSIDRAAYERRCHLLDSVVGWYANETTLIDNALIRMRELRPAFAAVAGSRSTCTASQRTAYFRLSARNPPTLLHSAGNRRK
jgi:hypothetical protein